MQQEDITITNICMPNDKPSKSMKQKMTALKRIDTSTTTVGDFNDPLKIMCKITRQNIRKEVEDLKDTINQPEQTYLEHSAQQQDTFFSSALELSSRIDHMLGHKLCLNRFRKKDI